MDWQLGMNLEGFARNDATRRAMARQMQALGWCAQETPSEIVFSAPGVRLRAYGGAPAGPVLVLVPAPIKRHFILDLAPHCSVVRQSLARACRVFLVEWEEPGEENCGLADYADRMLGACLSAVAERSGVDKLVVAGYSLGGTLAAIHATLHPERIAGLILLGAPVAFEAEHDIFSTLLSGPGGRQLPTSGTVPGSLLNTAAFLAAPLSIGVFPWLDRYASVSDHETRDTLMRVSCWTHDEMPLSARLLCDVAQRLYRENALMRGTLAIGDRLADPARLTAPVLGVGDPHCALVPMRSIEAFLEAVGASDTRVLYYHGDRGVLIQHIGMLVGHSAHCELWPRILEWVHAHAERPN